MKANVVGRLAPSPTGFLHLGNAWSFLWAWLWARSERGRLVLRMEDIDPDRSRMEYVSAIEQDLKWLGLDWDGPTLMQSSRHEQHIKALESLGKNGHTYPCYCTRKELRSLAGAPHVGDMGAPYTGICANLNDTKRMQMEIAGRRAALRLRCPQSKSIEFIDGIYGPQSYDLQKCGGDFALRRSDGVVAYQLAVVVDDAAQGVNHILRGADILTSTPRQIYLCNLLGLKIQHYTHVPLLLDDYGERLAKRHESMTIASLRDKGVKAERIMGLLTYLAGINDCISDVYVDELVNHFSFQKCRNMHFMQDIVVRSEYITNLFN